MWRMWRSHRELLWLGAGLVGLGCGVLLQLTWRPFSLPLYVLGFSCCYFLGFAAIAQALALRLGVSSQPRCLAAGIVMGLLLQAWFSVVEPNLETRLYIINTMSLCLLGLPLQHWRQMHMRNVFDQAIRWIAVGFIATMTVRMLVFLPLAEVNQSSYYNQSWLWLGMHVIGMIGGMLIAGAMFLAVLREEVGQLQLERQLDPLTKVLNRRGFEERFKQKKYEAASQTWSLLACDLDFFKRINDTWGHATGDRVLQVVTGILQDHVRGSDLVARFGGEEFVVLVAGDGLVAQRVAERIRQKVAQQAVSDLNGGHVTVSIGIAVLHDMSEKGLSQAFRQADAMLYTAKRSGRNQVVMQQQSSPPMPSTFQFP